MKAQRIAKATQTQMHTRPVFVQGIMQDALRQLTAPCDAVSNGVALRLPAGCVIGVVGGGSSGLHGSLQTDVDFSGEDGETYRATKGMSLLIPPAA